MGHSEIRLYVKSVKVVTGTTLVQHARLRESYAVETEPMHGYMLDEDQQKTVELVKEIARKYFLELEVVDMTRENVLRRVVQKERERIRVFPTLVAGSEQRVEGKITEEQIEPFFSRIAGQGRKKYL